MTVSITLYGNEVNYWNAGLGGGSSVIENILVNTNSTANLINFSATFDSDVYTGTVKGDFQFNGPISTLDQVSGLFTEFTVYKNGLISEQNIITQGADLINWLAPTESAPQFISQESTINSGVTLRGSQGYSTYGDALIGGASRDSFSSFSGNKKDQFGYFNGMGDIDTAVMQGKLIEYKLETKTFTDYTDMNYVRPISGWWVTDNVANRNGLTMAANVERVQFSDINIALDIGPTQNAGSVYMLYKAAFNRAPDANGMGYWIAQKDGGANIVTNIAQGFVNSGEFTAKYGTNPSNASYVDKLYLNVLGRAGEAGGVAYWNQELNAGNISKAAVLVQFATLAEGAANVAPLIANGIAYQEWIG